MSSAVPTPEPRGEAPSPFGGGPGASEPSGPGPGHRRGSDRRVQPTPRLSRWSFGAGRRRGARREGEGRGAFVDRYGIGPFLLVGWVALMNVADSVFTMIHLRAGGIELNPVADLMLQSGRLGFALAKSALIGVALFVLCVHIHFPLARFGLYAAAGMYTLLCAYHVALFFVP
jgi:hypothetical protein